MGARNTPPQNQGKQMLKNNVIIPSPSSRDEALLRWLEREVPDAMVAVQILPDEASTDRARAAVQLAYEKRGTAFRAMIYDHEFPGGPDKHPDIVMARAERRLTRLTTLSARAALQQDNNPLAEIVTTRLVLVKPWRPFVWPPEDVSDGEKEANKEGQTACGTGEEEPPAGGESD